MLVVAPAQVAIAQLAARRSHNPKVVSPILTCHIRPCPEASLDANLEASLKANLSRQPSCALKPESKQASKQAMRFRSLETSQQACNQLMLPEMEFNVTMWAL